MRINKGNARRGLPLLAPLFLCTLHPVEKRCADSNEFDFKRETACGGGALLTGLLPCSAFHVHYLLPFFASHRNLFNGSTANPLNGAIPSVVALNFSYNQTVLLKVRKQAWLCQSCSFQWRRKFGSVPNRGKRRGRFGGSPRFLPISTFRANRGRAKQVCRVSQCAPRMRQVIIGIQLGLCWRPAW